MRINCSVTGPVDGRDGSEVAVNKDPKSEDKQMKTTLLYVRRLTVVAALLGVVVSPRAASAQSQLDTSEATAFIGSWTISMQGDFAFEFPLVLEDQGGKVAANVGGFDPSAGMTAVTNITRSGEGILLRYDIDAQGQIVPASLEITPSGDGFVALLEIADGAFTVDGTATKAN